MKKYLLVPLLTLILSSCNNFIDKQSEMSVTFTNFYKTEKDIEVAMNTAHMMLRGTAFAMRIPEYAGELVGPASKDQDATAQACMTHNFNLPNLAMTGKVNWDYYYNTIYACNSLIDNISDVTRKNVKKERLDFYIGQINFILGMCYFELGRRWGDAPIVKSSLKKEWIAKSSNKLVMAEAIAYANTAFEQLSPYTPDNMVDSNGKPMKIKQYACKATVATLLANIHAWLGGQTNDKNYFIEAERYATMVLGENGENGSCGNYRFAPDPERVCVEVMDVRSSYESIFEIHLTAEDNSIYGSPFNWGGLLVAYPVDKNLLIGDIKKKANKVKSSFIRTIYNELPDKRLDAYFFEFDKLEKEPLAAGYAFLNKWRKVKYEGATNDPNAKMINFDTNKIIWRLADLMLLRAECRVRIGDESGAIHDLNRIRERAGVKIYPQGVDDAKMDLQKAIFKEREKELLYEGHRYFDIIRNGYTEEFPVAFRGLTEQDIIEGALYTPVHSSAFLENPLMVQNLYWYKKQ